MNKFSLNLRGAMEAHQTSNLGVLSSSLSEDVFILSVARETLMNIFIKNDRNKMSMKNRKKLMISIVSDLYSKDKKGEKFKKRYKRFYKSYIFKRNRRKLRKSRVNFF